MIPGVSRLGKNEKKLSTRISVIKSIHHRSKAEAEEEECLNRHLGEWDIKGCEQTEGDDNVAGILIEEGSKKVCRQNLSFDSPIIERAEHDVEEKRVDTNLEDLIIFQAEKKMRDRESKREKQGVVDQDVSELSGRSLSESDLVSSWEIKTREARKILKIGKGLELKLWVTKKRQLGILLVWTRGQKE
ncbi:hypothetical protein V6N13_125684 [Hibiscus sabdariffa]